MFVDLAEEQVIYWVEQARGAGAGTRPTSMHELAAKFGGKVVKGMHG